jgi:hypothetical protein
MLEVETRSAQNSARVSFRVKIRSKVLDVFFFHQ